MTTFNVTNNSATVTATTDQSTLISAGNSLAFASQTAHPYIVASVATTTITLTKVYTGTSNAATSITTFHVTNGSATVTASVTQTGLIAVGYWLLFGSQEAGDTSPGIPYRVTAVATTTITISPVFSGTSQTLSAATIVPNATAYGGVVGKQITSSSGLTAPDEALGLYGFSQSNPSPIHTTSPRDRDFGTTLATRQSSVGLPVPPAGGSTTTYYKLRARDTGASYVEWVTTTTPLTTGSYPGSPVGSLVDLVVLSIYTH